MQVAALESSVASNTLVGDTRIKRCNDRYWTGPVLGGDGPLQSRQVHVGHADEAPAAERGLVPVAVAEAKSAHQYGIANVQLVMVTQELDIRQANRLIVADAKLENQP